MGDDHEHDITSCHHQSCGSLPGEMSSIVNPVMPLLRALADGMHFLALHRARRLAKAKLNALDDRMLRDIGLDRSEIRSMLTDSARERTRGIVR